MNYLRYIHSRCQAKLPLQKQLRFSKSVPVPGNVFDSRQRPGKIRRWLGRPQAACRLYWRMRPELLEAIHGRRFGLPGPAPSALPPPSGAKPPAPGSSTIDDALGAATAPQAGGARPLGRPASTGRFETRAELLDRIWSFHLLNGLSDDRIAKNVEVSAGTVRRVLSTGEGRPQD